jgi:hypothetical protein
MDSRARPSGACTALPANMPTRAYGWGSDRSYSGCSATCRASITSTLTAVCASDTAAQHDGQAEKHQGWEFVANSCEHQVIYHRSLL